VYTKPQLDILYLYVSAGQPVLTVVRFFLSLNRSVYLTQDVDTRVDAEALLNSIGMTAMETFGKCCSITCAQDQELTHHY